MTIKNPDAIIVGAGWAGTILAKELTEAGLSVVVLERGPDRTTAVEGAYPDSIDELRGAVRHRLFQNLSKTTVTIRNKPDQTALPYRQLAAFLPGEGVGGAGVHWSGVHFRASPEDLTLRSTTIDRYGEKFIPDGMNLQDYGVTYDELEPFFDKAEKVFGTSGIAYKINGQIVGDGNVFAPSRSDAFPLPPLKDVYSARLFREAARSVGYHPYSLPAANASAQYTNSYGVQMGPCNFCGFCSGYDCYMYSKASPNVNILPALRQDPKFSLVTGAHVLRVNLDTAKQRATGVTYLDIATDKQITIDADLVILSAFQFHNVHLMLLSGIGRPYDYSKNEGVVGRNFVYQTITTSRAWLSEKQFTNQFIGTGGGGVALDDFNSMNFDHGPLGFVGGSPIWVNQAGVKPIAASGTGGGHGSPRWGAGYKKGLVHTYKHAMAIDAHGSNMAYRDIFLDLDPTWKDAYGQPLLRMTFTWKDNDVRMNRYVVGKIEPIMKALGAEKYELGLLNYGEPFDTRVYKTTHLGGGAVMGPDPKTSALNRYLQSWDVSNVFVVGANAFPQGMGYNPTGTVAALAYWAAHHIRTTYLRNPGPLVQL